MSPTPRIECSEAEPACHGASSTDNARFEYLVAGGLRQPQCFAGGAATSALPSGVPAGDATVSRSCGRSSSLTASSTIASASTSRRTTRRTARLSNPSLPLATRSSAAGAADRSTEALGRLQTDSPLRSTTPETTSMDRCFRGGRCGNAAERQTGGSGSWRADLRRAVGNPGHIVGKRGTP